MTGKVASILGKDRGNMTMGRATRRGVISRREFNRAIKFLQRARAKERCHFCRKPGSDHFAMVAVSVHLKCYVKRNREVLRKWKTATI